MREITIDQVAEAMQRGLPVIDVRERNEYVRGHVPGAVHIPMGHLPGRLHEIDRDGPVYVICATGNRSGAMTDLLVASGLDAANVVGGTSAWARSGRPLERARA